METPTPKPDAIIWTDGSCSQDKHGGWAALVAQWLPIGEIRRTEITGHVYPTTNNAMEMQAAIEGLSYLTTPHHVYLVSDSAYLLNTLRNQWYKKWQQEKDATKPRPNWDLWMRLIELTNYHDVEYVKVRGHRGDPYNERVDKLCVQARKDGQRAAKTVVVSEVQAGHPSSPGAVQVLDLLSTGDLEV